MGDLALVWVSQQQGDPQVIGYIEGAPPAPMANLTNKPSYAGATSVTFNAPISLSYRYVSNNDGSSTDKGSGKANADVTGTKSGQAPAPAVVSLPPVTNPLTGETDEGAETVVTLNNDNNPVRITLNDQNQIQSVSAPKSNGGSGNMHFSFEIGPVLAALGFGINSSSQTVKLDLEAGIGFSGGKTNGTTSQDTSSEKLDEGLEGAMAPYSGDTFMANLNSLTVASTTAGTPASKVPILPNPNLGGFTTSNPPGALPKTTLTEERFGQRMFVPSPYGQAFVTSTTNDVYQQILLQTNTTFGFISVPDLKIPRDINILSFRMSSKYLRPGSLDGMIGYQYNPATLASGATSWQTSTGQLSPLYDGNFAPGEVGHEASYMRVIDAYQTKKQIDHQGYNAMAQYA